VNIGMEFARRSRRRDSLRVSVWVWDNVSDFAMMGSRFVKVDNWRMMVMSTGFRPMLAEVSLGVYDVRRRR